MTADIFICYLYIKMDIYELIFIFLTFQTFISLDQIQISAEEIILLTVTNALHIVVLPICFM